eukprot:CAMPEP_0202422268 /NCGR_PEP_ID=MMETSP1128-20130828/50769_1 /ASSEMBLY_ACC=CAM_ASM_000463 /TAXON_ID=3047 /ORGANISM="Dunaliella tertiolecta, Strain CCMP1320" /LENGTH=1339 /DNA_ID=CAMNT_0049030323 /DNA_START=157 /DNA_END=4177 /DNA_ORIENTATION=-
MESHVDEVLAEVSQHEPPLEQPSLEKPIILFDLNGVLVGERAPDERARIWTSRPGIALLLLLLPRYQLGVYSSATWKNVHAAIQQVFKDVNNGRKNLHKQHPAPLLRQSEVAALEQNSQGGQPHPAVLKKKGKKGLQFGRSIPGFVMPANASQLFTGGVFHRDHCIQDPHWETRPDGHDWDTVKPLAQAGLPLGRVLLVDNEMRKVMAGEESSAVELPTWEACTDGGVACLRKLVELLLSLPIGTDLREHSTDISAQVKACANISAAEWAGSTGTDVADEESDDEEEYEETEHGAKRRRVGEQAHADISYGYTDPAQLHHGTAAYQGWGVGSVSSGDAGAAGCPTMGDGSGYLSVGGNDSSGGSAAVGDGSGYLVPLPSWQQQQQQAPALLPPASGGFALPPGSKVSKKKPFPCEVCPKAFADAESACKHMQMKHKMEPSYTHSLGLLTPPLPFPCTIDGCIKCFATEAARTQHAHQKHGAAQQQQQQQALMAASSPEAAVSSEPTPFLVYSGEEPVAQVTGLQPGGAYQFRVLAINSQGPGPWSDWGVLGTAAGVPPPPSPPVAASRPSSSAIAIKWQPPLSSSGAPVTSYVVQLLVVGFVPSEGGEPRLVVRKPAAALAQGMNGGCHRSRAGSGSHPLSGSTDQGSQGGIGSSHGGASSASVSASTHSDEVLGENGLYHDLTGVAQAGGAEDLAPFAPQWMPVCKCNTTSTELRGLEPSTRYAIRVAAINRVGQGSWSADGLLQTAPAPPTPPSSVQAEAMGPKEIGVTWLPCALDNGAPLLAYAVDLLRLGAAGSTTFARMAHAAGSTGPWEHVINTGPSDNSALISGLHPGRSYRVRVRALNACGPSAPSSAPTLVTTHAAPPGPPGKVVVMQRGATHARFKWEPCIEENGAAVNQYWLEINGPVADDFAPSGDAAKPAGGHTGLNRRASQADSADGSMDDLASAAVLSSGEGASAWRVAYVGASTQARVNGLLPATHYWCRVTGLNRTGPGACSQAEAFTSALLPPGPPQDPEVCVENAADVLDGSWASPGAHAPTAANLRHANSEVVVVRWEPPVSNPLEAAPVGYEVQATPCGTHGGAVPGPQGPGEVRCSAPKNALECVIERGLLPGVSYLVRVRAIGAGGSGHGAWSPAVEVTAPGKLGANSESAASVSDLNDGASSASYQPSMDCPASRPGTTSKRGKGKGGQAAAAAAHAQHQQQQRSGASGGKVGGVAHKVVAQASATALSKPAPPTMTIRGMKYQAGRLWRRTKAHKLQILVFLMVAAAGFAVQNNLSVEMLRQYRDQILLTLMVLVACALVWLVAMWIAWRAPPPPKPTSKSKKKERVKAQGFAG